jgi:hypothetical protein
MKLISILKEVYKSKNYLIEEEKIIKEVGTIEGPLYGDRGIKFKINHFNKEKNDDKIDSYYLIKIKYPIIEDTKTSFGNKIVSFPLTVDVMVDVKAYRNEKREMNSKYENVKEINEKILETLFPAVTKKTFDFVRTSWEPLIEKLKEVGYKEVKGISGRTILAKKGISPKAEDHLDSAANKDKEKKNFVKEVEPPRPGRYYANKKGKPEDQSKNKYKLITKDGKQYYVLKDEDMKKYFGGKEEKDDKPIARVRTAAEAKRFRR